MAQNIDFSGYNQIQTPQYPKIHPPSNEISDEAFHAKEDLMKSIQTLLEEFNCIPFEEKPLILLQAWFKFFAIQYAKPEDPNELFQKLLEDLKELVEYDNYPTKEEPPQDSDIHQLIKECSTEVSEEQNQSIEDTMLELVKICRQKELLCMHDNVNDLIESALNSKLLSINSQRLDKKEQEVKNVVEQPVEHGNRSIESLQNFRVIRKSSTFLKDTSQISSVHAIAPILSAKEPEHSLSMGYEHLSITPEMESDEVTESSAKNLLPIPSECEVTLEDESKCDMPIQDQSSSVFTTFPNTLFNNNDDLDSSDDESLFEQDENDSQREEIDIITSTDDVLPPGVENNDPDGEVDAVDDLRVDNSISNSEHESSESEESDFDNPSILLPPPKPPDEELDFEIDFGDEISVVRNNIVEFECIDARVKFDVSNDENDDLSYFMFVIFAKVFSFLSAESEDTIFDPGIFV
nr:hypothetical protein [Tanacetum cinerariifolium]